MNRIVDARDHVFSDHVPLIIIGAGACGLIAALKASDCGADVLILEQDDSPSGSTSLSSGFIPAAGTGYQRDAGIHDDAERFADDIQRKAGGRARKVLVDSVSRHCGPTLEWLANDHGLEWVVLDDFLYPGHSVHRMHAVPERTGAALMARLLTAAEAAGVAIATGARVTALIVDGTQVRGVEVLRGDGTVEAIGCSALVLACSGYGGNRELVEKYIPDMSGSLYFGHAGNRGDALGWGLQLGAAVGDLTGYQGHGSVATPHGILISWALMMMGGIQVNSLGRRFANEHRGYSEQAVPVLSQPRGIVWCLYDQRIHEAGLQFADYNDAIAAGAIRSANDIISLCEVTGLPTNALTRTLEEVSQFRQESRTDPLGRSFVGETAFEAPFYAVKVTGALFHSQGGLMIDSAARVVDDAGRPLGNLCAGGGAACGVSGPEASGYLSGNGLLSAVSFGALAGRSAAEMVVDRSN